MFRQLKACLRSELERRPDLFEAMRSRRPSLAKFADVFGVLGFLNDESAVDHSLKDAVTEAMLREYQESLSDRYSPSSTYATTLLLAAFAPMMRGLRAGAFSRAVDADDLDHLIVEAFLTAAKSVRLDGRARLPIRLKCRTHRAVFRQIRTESRGRQKLDQLAKEVAADSERGPFDRRNDKTATYLDHDETEPLAKQLVERFGKEIEPSRLELLVATVVRGEPLTRIVRAQHPDASEADLVRLYQRIKRQQSRTLIRLQKLWEGVSISCPQSEGAGLFLLKQPERSPYA